MWVMGTQGPEPETGIKPRRSVWDRGGTHRLLGRCFLSVSLGLPVLDVMWSVQCIACALCDWLLPNRFKVLALSDQIPRFLCLYFWRSGTPCKWWLVGSEGKVSGLQWVDLGLYS